MWGPPNEFRFLPNDRLSYAGPGPDRQEARCHHNHVGCGGDMHGLREVVRGSRIRQSQRGEAQSSGSSILISAKTRLGLISMHAASNASHQISQWRKITLASAPANPRGLRPLLARPLANTAVNGRQPARNFSIPDARTKQGRDHRHSANGSMNGAGQNDTQEAGLLRTTAIAAPDNSVNAPIADSHRNRRSQHWQHGAFFGFRF